MVLVFPPHQKHSFIIAVFKMIDGYANAMAHKSEACKSKKIVLPRDQLKFQRLAIRDRF